MKFKEKVIIFLASALISFVGFGLIAFPYVDILVVGKEAGYEQISNFLAKADVSKDLNKSVG